MSSSYRQPRFGGGGGGGRGGPGGRGGGSGGQRRQPFNGNKSAGKRGGRGGRAPAPKPGEPGYDPMYDFSLNRYGRINKFFLSYNEGRRAAVIGGTGAAGQELGGAGLDLSGMAIAGDKSPKMMASSAPGQVPIVNGPAPTIDPHYNNNNNNIDLGGKSALLETQEKTSAAAGQIAVVNGSAPTIDPRANIGYHNNNNIDMDNAANSSPEMAAMAALFNELFLRIERVIAEFGSEVVEMFHRQQGQQNN